MTPRSTTTSAELAADVTATLARHADERERVARGDASPAYADALAAVHQAEREQLARTVLQFILPSWRRAPTC